MKNILLKHLLRQRRQKTGQSQRSELGFTILELMVVVIIVGIFAAIAAPAWDAFVNRQRIRAVNGQVLQALQSAQSEAKRKKQSVTVTFAYTEDDPLNDPPRYVFHKPTTTIENSDKQEESLYAAGKTGIIQDWKNFSIDSEIDRKMVKLDMYNIPQGQYSLDQGIPFTDQGIVDTEKLDEYGGSLPIKVVISTPDGGLKRCVIVQTLLGAMITAEGDDPDTGCGSN